jgi:hypothetical protein
VASVAGEPWNSLQLYPTRCLSLCEVRFVGTARAACKLNTRQSKCWQTRSVLAHTQEQNRGRRCQALRYPGFWLSGTRSSTFLPRFLAAAIRSGSITAVEMNLVLDWTSAPPSCDRRTGAFRPASPSFIAHNFKTQQELPRPTPRSAKYSCTTQVGISKSESRG